MLSDTSDRLDNRFDDKFLCGILTTQSLTCLSSMETLLIIFYIKLYIFAIIQRDSKHISKL